MRLGTRVKLVRYDRKWYEGSSPGRSTQIGRIGILCGSFPWKSNSSEDITTEEHVWINFGFDDGVWWHLWGLEPIAFEHRTYSAWRQMLPRHREIKPKQSVEALFNTWANWSRATVDRYGQPAASTSELTQARLELARIEGEARAVYRMTINPSNPDVRRITQQLDFARDRVTRLEQSSGHSHQ